MSEGADSASTMTVTIATVEDTAAAGLDPPPVADGAVARNTLSV